MDKQMQAIKTIAYSDFKMWDVKRYSFVFHASFENAVCLREILTPFKQAISKEGLLENNWKIIKKINFHGELFLRESSDITSYKGKLNKVPDNSIIYSKINVRHGCVYYHEKGKKPFAVSSEYPTFVFDEAKVDGYYLQRVLRSNEFKRLLNVKTSGISKARVKVDEFLDIQIPLPPLDKQQQIVEAYNAKINLAQKQEEEAKALEESIDSYLSKVLGIEKLDEKEGVKGLQLINYGSVSRWDVWLNIGRVKSNKYENTCLKSIVIGKPQYGANVKGVKRKSETRYIRITDINEDGELNDEFVSPASVDERFLLNENDFLIARSGNTVGKTFLFKEKYGRAIYAGYLVKYNVNNTKVVPEYLLTLSKSYLFKKWIESNQRVSGQPNINGQEFLNAPLVLPPLEIQHEIVKHVFAIKEKIKALQAQAKDNREKAVQELEKEIFSS